MEFNWKRDAALLVGGFALGAVASRLLPPVAAMGAGAVRARMGRDPFDRLIQDHREVLATLRAMEEAPADSHSKKAKLFLELKRTLAKHALAEEDIVYPLLHDDAGSTHDTKHLYDEHADIKIHLFELERLLKNGQDWTARVTELRRLIEGHIRQEEEVEFPKLRQTLNEQRSRKLSGLISREEAMVL